MWCDSCEIPEREQSGNTETLTDGRHDEQPDDDDSDDDLALKFGGSWALGQAAAQHQHHAGDHAACTAPISVTAPRHIPLNPNPSSLNHEPNSVPVAVTAAGHTDQLI